MNATRAYLRSLDPHLPRSVWLVQIGGAVNAFGTGMVIPFTLIYLHNVRGISLAAAGAAVGIGAVAALATGVLAGSVVDRVGGRNTLVFGLLLQAGSMRALPAGPHRLGRRGAPRAPGRRHGAASGPGSRRCSPGSPTPRRATTPTRCSGSA